jgi:hypothetical protein
MQSEMQFYETSGCPTEHNREVYQEPIHCHQSNRRASDCSQPCNDVNICDHSRNVHHNNDVTDASVNCCCAGAKALELDASSQVKCPKQDAEYLEMVASDVDDNSARGDNRLSSCQADCRDKHDKDYLQPAAYKDYLQIVDYDYYTQLAAHDDYLLQIALHLRYFGSLINKKNKKIKEQEDVYCTGQ